MGKKASKATKKFVASGQLKKTIQARHKHQEVRKKVERKKARKGGKVNSDNGEDARDDDEAHAFTTTKKSKSRKGMTVDDILNASFMEGSDSEEGLVEQDLSDEEGQQSDNDGASFASIDELDEDDDEGQAHLMELSKLAEKDPEFYKYLQENDRELLDFNPDNLTGNEDSEMGEEDIMVGGDEEKVPTLTTKDLKRWQKALLEQRSLRALRKLLIAFRSAAHMNEDGQVLAWSIDSSSVYNKLIVTTLRYVPVVLEHHVPYKTSANGKFKPPPQTPKLKALQKLIFSYFHNIIHILSQLTDDELVRLALTESAKIIPYIISSRKTVKQYVKKCLELWSSAEDNVRIAAFLPVRKLASSSDESIMDTILKSTYLSLIRSSKSTSAHTLPSINLMKNSASEVFCVNQAISYQHAFGYIRQLAIHLRNSMKIKNKEAYKQVYNWQFVHCIDFWCIVLAKACNVQAETEAGKESELRSLIYPLVQVSLGSIKLVQNGRSHPFHLHICRSLLHLTRHAQTYVPLSPCLVPILTSALAPAARPKSSTLRPLDFDVNIRVPQQYMKTRVLSEGLAEEVVFYLAEWLCSPAVHGSIAFPEIVVPIVVSLRKSLKVSKTGSSKEQMFVKALLERIDDSSQWMNQRRKDVSLSPGQLSEVKDWETSLKLRLDDTPLNKYLNVQRKMREKRRKLIEKAREGKNEILEES